MSLNSNGRLLAIALGASLLAALPAAAQQKPLTVDAIYDPDRKVEFGGAPATGLAWLSDTHFLWSKGSPAAHLKVDALTGRSEPFFDAARVERALVGEGATAELARQAVGSRTLAMNAARTALLLPIGGHLYTYDLAAHKAARVTRGEGAAEEAAFSPDGKTVSFVRNHNLTVASAAGAGERPLTTDGSADILNGKLDWVYQEEVYGRGIFRAYWWSPNSRYLAFLRLDETAVPKYTIVDDIPTRPVVEVYPYPKAGDPNPAVKLGLVDVSGNAPPRFADLGKYAGEDILIVDVAWRPDGQVVFQVQDREQTWLDLNLADPATGAVTTLFRETTPAWVEVSGSPRFLKDGSFLWLSERDGWKHVYHYRADGTQPKQLTKGEWEVRTLYGADEANRLLYFSSTDRSAIDRDVSRARLDGTGRVRLSAVPGQHEASFNPSFTHYLDTWSDAHTPHQVRLHRADGREARVVDANDVPALREYRLARWEFFQVKTRDGFPMEAALIKPPGFDPSRKYPVYQHTYGGPHAPQVRNGWYSASLFLQLVAENGVVVFVCDNRSASGKGLVSAATAYKRMGPQELLDVEDGVGWLKSQPWVDPERIGIGGWSYGGTMTAYALTHSRSFAMGIAGAPVTDWRNYDSIYTERVMRTPAHNEEGYRVTSINRAAKDLHGQLLLIHGTIDDNVHPQNSLQFAYELQKAGRPFRMMMYPRTRHAPAEPLLVKHLRTGMLDFIRETLRPGR